MPLGILCRTGQPTRGAALRNSYLPWLLNCCCFVRDSSTAMESSARLSIHHGEVAEAPRGGHRVRNRNHQHQLRPARQCPTQLSEGAKRFQTVGPGPAVGQLNSGAGRFPHSVAIAGQRTADRRVYFYRVVARKPAEFRWANCADPVCADPFRVRLAPQGPFSPGTEPTGTGAPGGKSLGGAAGVRNYATDLAAVRSRRPIEQHQQHASNAGKRDRLNSVRGCYSPTSIRDRGSR